MRDGLVLVENSKHLALLDAATGAPRWQLTAHEDLPTDSCFDATGPRDEKSLKLLSVDDASVLWRARLQPSVDHSQPAPPRFELQLADDRIAVVTYEGGSTAAVSVATGETIWTRPDVWPVAIAGDTLLTQVGDKPSSSPGWGDLEDGTVTALDPATGATRWAVADRSEVVRTGHEIDAKLPGEPVAVTADQIYFRPYSNSQTTDAVSCYALS